MKQWRSIWEFMTLHISKLLCDSICYIFKNVVCVCNFSSKNKNKERVSSKKKKTQNWKVF